MPLDQSQVMSFFTAMTALFCERNATECKASRALGEVRNAYDVILADYDWRIKNAINQLWLYSTGNIDHLPVV